MSTSLAPLAVFAFLMAASDVVHLMVFSIPSSQLDQAAGYMWWLDLSVALAVIFRPSSVPRFLTLLCLDVVGIASMMPEVPNHLLFLLLADCIIIAGIACSYFATIQPQFAHNRAATQLESFAWAVRVQVVLLYLLSALHKSIGDFSIRPKAAPQRACAG